MSTLESCWHVGVELPPPILGGGGVVDCALEEPEDDEGDDEGDGEVGGQGVGGGVDGLCADEVHPGKEELCPVGASEQIVCVGD